MRELVKRLVPLKLRTWIRSCQSLVQPLWYIGNRVECPICGARYREFLPFGRPERKNAWCYKCDSLERHRALYVYLERHTQLLQKPGILLHFAPERCLDRVLRLSGKLRIVTTDLDRNNVALLSDITKLPFSSASFDGVLCSHVMEHIPDDAAAMGELQRVLKPGGMLLLQIPLRGAETYENWAITSPEARRLHFGQEDHVRYYGEDIKDRLERAGFQVSIQSLPECRERYGLKEERIYVCQPAAASDATS